MNKKGKSMWGGRFSETPDEFMIEFGASLDVDIELLEFDIKGSVAWAEALGMADILNPDEVKKIIDGLIKVEEDIKAECTKREKSFDLSLEDIHMTVESMLTDKIGDIGAKLHTGRSRNDQVAVDERMYLLSKIDMIIDLIKSVQEKIISQADKYVESVVSSYTHLQQAQPVRLSHYIMSWFWMLQRDKERFRDAKKRTDSMPLGSGAVAGSGFAVDRGFLAEKLGFTSITENSIDAVSDRDYIIETISAASVLMMHLSRIAEDLIIWSSAEFGFVEIPEKYSTGSSMMPQKKNPDSLELVRGKTGRVYGNLLTILTVMKGLPLSYNKDMQEDKTPLFDSIKTVHGCLRIMKGVIEGIKFNTVRMEEAIDKNIFATDFADFLTKQGKPFREAYKIAATHVKWSKENGKLYTTMFGNISKEIGDDFFELTTSTDRRSLPGGTGKKPLLKQINKAKKILSMKDS